MTLLTAYAAAPPVLGTVAGLWRYPVKSMQGEAMDAVTVTRQGVAGDRAYAVFAAGETKPLSAKREPRLLHAAAAFTATGVVVTLPDGTRCAAPSPELDEALSAWLGRPVRVGGGGPYPDAAPLHVLTTAALRAAAREHPAGDWSPRRFRANLLVDVPGAAYAEDAWPDLPAVAAGSVRFCVVKPTVRCPMTVAAQPGLPADPAVLGTLRAAHAARLGAYAVVDVPGGVTSGDRVTTASAG